MEGEWRRNNSSRQIWNLSLPLMFSSCATVPKVPDSEPGVLPVRPIMLGGPQSTRVEVSSNEIELPEPILVLGSCRRDTSDSGRGSGPSQTFPFYSPPGSSEVSAVATLSFLSQEEKLGFSDPFWQIHVIVLCWEGPTVRREHPAEGVVGNAGD